MASCKYPNLHGLWLRPMSRTGSSVTVERSFSAQALLQTPHRNRLSEESINELLPIRYNYKTFSSLKGDHFVTRWIECYEGIEKKGELTSTLFV